MTTLKTYKVTTPSGAVVAATVRRHHEDQVTDAQVDIIQDGRYAGTGTLGPGGLIEDCDARLGAADGSETLVTYRALEAAIAGE